MWILLSVTVCALALVPLLASADEGTFRAQVTHVLSEEEVTIPGTDVVTVVQRLRAITDDGEEVVLDNDRVALNVGDHFFGTYLDTDTGRIYSVRDPDRRGLLALAVGLFVFSTTLVGRLTGARALVSLGFSVAAILFVLLPLLASGWNPLVVSLGASTAILAVAMALTHGISRTTIAAFTASTATIVSALFLGEFFVRAARIAGFASDEAAILNLTTGGSLNMEGLLLGAIVIGVLGIIDDLTITQGATVSALRNANPTLSARELYRQAMAVGREHLGAVVNTLVLAYAGGALPLLLLFSLSPSSPLTLINSDVMAIEIIRASVGGVALALALPLSTWLAVSMGAGRGKSAPPSHVFHGRHPH